MTIVNILLCAAIKLLLRLHSDSRKSFSYCHLTNIFILRFLLVIFCAEARLTFEIWFSAEVVQSKTSLIEFSRFLAISIWPRSKNRQKRCTATEKGIERYKGKYRLIDGSPGLVVMGGDLWSEGHGFESQHWMDSYLH